MMEIRYRLLAIVMLGIPVLLLGCGGGDDPEPDELPMEVVDIAPEPEVVEPEPEPIEPEPAFALPPLSDSDPLVRQQAGTLSGNELLARYLAPRDLIARFVVLVENVASGSVPRQHVESLVPEGSFAVLQMGEENHVVDKRSYRRFDSMATVFTSLDTSASVAAYRLLQPLFQEAYGQLGKDGQFDRVVIQAIDHLLDTPVVTDEHIRLNRPSVMYRYADKRLEGLSDAQKQLLRMGPDNTRRIQDKLKEFRQELR